MFVLELYEHLYTLELNNQYTNEWCRVFCQKLDTIGELKSHVQISRFIMFASFSEW